MPRLRFIFASPPAFGPLPSLPMTLPSRLLSLLLLFGLAAVSDVAHAQNGGNEKSEHNGKSDASEKKNDSLPASVRRVERQTGGDVLRAEPMQRDGREVYRVKVLTSDGRVKVIQDDPQQGRSDDPPAGGRRNGKPPSQNGDRDDDGDPS